MRKRCFYWCRSSAPLYSVLHLTLTVKLFTAQVWDKGAFIDAARLLLEVPEHSRGIWDLCVCTSCTCETASFLFLTNVCTCSCARERERWWQTERKTERGKKSLFHVLQTYLCVCTSCARETRSFWGATQPHRRMYMFVCVCARARARKRGSEGWRKRGRLNRGGGRESVHARRNGGREVQYLEGVRARVLYNSTSFDEHLLHLLRVPWLIHMCATTHAYACQDLFMCNLTHSTASPSTNIFSTCYACHDSFICVQWHTPWLIHMCDMNACMCVVGHQSKAFLNDCLCRHRWTHVWT